MPDRARPEPALVAVALGGLCPRCGAKTLFTGFARFAARCRACGLDISAFNGAQEGRVAGHAE